MFASRSSLVVFLAFAIPRTELRGELPTPCACSASQGLKMNTYESGLNSIRVGLQGAIQTMLLTLPALAFNPEGSLLSESNRTEMPILTGPQVTWCLEDPGCSALQSTLWFSTSGGDNAVRCKHRSQNLESPVRPSHLPPCMKTCAVQQNKAGNVAAAIWTFLHPEDSSLTPTIRLFAMPKDIDSRLIACKLSG